MGNDHRTALLDYITSTLTNEPSPFQDDVYYWTDGDLEVTPAPDRLASGWLVILETDPDAVYVNFAEDVSPLVQERLKALIGHCVVQGIACHTPWLAINVGTTTDVASRLQMSVQ